MEDYPQISVPEFLKQLRQSPPMSTGRLAKAVLAFEDHADRIRILHGLCTEEFSTVVPDCRFWRLTGEVLTQTHSLYASKDEILAILHDGRDAAYRPLMMNCAERRALLQLPDVPLVVYRGCNIHRLLGWSWTLSPEKAPQFSKYQIIETPLVAAGYIRPQDVTALFLRCNEDEVFVDPALVSEKVTFELRDFRNMLIEKDGPPDLNEGLPVTQ